MSPAAPIVASTALRILRRIRFFFAPVSVTPISVAYVNRYPLSAAIAESCGYCAEGVSGETMVKDFTSHEKRSFSQKEISRLGEYLIEELPELIARTPIVGYTYDACAHPFESEITVLAEQIQMDAIFPEIRQKMMDTEAKVFLEVR